MRCHARVWSRAQAFNSKMQCTAFSTHVQDGLGWPEEVIADDMRSYEL